MLAEPKVALSFDGAMEVLQSCEGGDMKETATLDRLLKALNVIEKCWHTECLYLIEQTGHLLKHTYVCTYVHMFIVSIAPSVNTAVVLKLKLAICC